MPVSRTGRPHPVDDAIGGGEISGRINTAGEALLDAKLQMHIAKYQTWYYTANETVISYDKSYFKKSGLWRVTED